MSRLLLDTHVLLWWLSGDEYLGQNAIDVIANPDNEVFISAASVWEIGIKKALGKLEAPDNFDQIIEDEGFTRLPVDIHHAEHAPLLPPIHKDPFDRMLVAQAQLEGLTLVTSAEQIQKYPVRIRSARS